MRTVASPIRFLTGMISSSNSSPSASSTSSVLRASGSPSVSRGNSIAGRSCTSTSFHSAAERSGCGRKRDMGPDHHSVDAPSLNRSAFAATWHCLTGCAIGEVLGLVIATALGWGNAASIALAIVLAFFFGYSFTLVPLLRAGLAFAPAVGLALVSDTLSIAVMEIVDNTIVLLWPGAMDAGLEDLLFWGSLAIALAIAFVAAFPVNRALIARGRGHAVVHAHHGH